MLACRASSRRSGGHLDGFARSLAMQPRLVASGSCRGQFCKFYAGITKAESVQIVVFSLVHCLKMHTVVWSVPQFSTPVHRQKLSVCLNHSPSPATKSNIALGKSHSYFKCQWCGWPAMPVLLWKTSQFFSVLTVFVAKGHKTWETCVSIHSDEILMTQQ